VAADDYYAQLVPKATATPRPAADDYYGQLAPAPKPATRAAPSGGARKGKVTSGSLLEPFLPILKGTARAAATDVGKVFDLLDRPRQVVTATATGGPGKLIPTLVHGQSPESIDRTRAELRAKLPGGLAEHYRNAPHLEQGAIDVGLDTLTDPVSLAGGLGVAEEAVNRGVRAGYPALARGLRKLDQVAPATTPLARVPGALHDFVTYKGGVKRDLAATYGAKGLDYYNGLRSINRTRRGKQSDLGNTLVNAYRDVTKGLSPEDEGELYKAIHTGKTEALMPQLRERAKGFSDLTDTQAHLSGTRGLRGQMGESGFTVPNYAKRFDTAIRSLQSPSQYRKDYVPTAHDLTRLDLDPLPQNAAEMTARVSGKIRTLRDLLTLRSRPDESIGSVDKTLRGPEADVAARSLLEAEHAPGSAGPSTVKELLQKDRNLNERAEGAQLLPPTQQRQVIDARLRGGAKAIAARDAEREVARLFGVGGFKKAPGPAKRFFEEKYTPSAERGLSQHVGDAIRSTIDLPKVAMFALPFRHMANIGSLSAVADPSVQNIGGTAKRFAQLLHAGGDAEKRAAVLGKSAKYGVSGAPSLDRESGVGWTSHIPGIGKIYETSNHVLWAFDDAAKATRFDRLLKQNVSRGMKEPAAAHDAAAQVSAELVDYDERSPLTDAARYVAPFATWRTKMPAAVGRTVVRHPERALVAGRASPELVGSEQKDPHNSGLVGKSYLPMSEAMRAVDDPWEYARATAGTPFKAAASWAGVHSERAKDGMPNYFTRGTPINNALDAGMYMGKDALGNIPGFEQAWRAVGGKSPFADRGAAGFASSVSGVGLTNAPSASAIRRVLMLRAYNAAIDRANAAGETARVDALRKRRDAMMSR